MKPSVSRNTAAPPLALTSSSSGLNCCPLTSSVCGSAAAAITPMPSAVSTAASATLTPVWARPLSGCSSEKPNRNSTRPMTKPPARLSPEPIAAIPRKRSAGPYQTGGRLSRAKGGGVCGCVSGRFRLGARLLGAAAPGFRAGGVFRRAACTAYHESVRTLCPSAPAGDSEKGGHPMAKKIEGYIKLQVPAGTATPSPPIGPALGQRGVNIMEFCKAFNAHTQELEKGMPIPTVITVYADRSFTFTTKTPPASFLIKKAANLKSGSKEPGKVSAGKIARSKLTEIAEMKMKDLNANDLEAATRIIEGSARAMGLEVVEG